MAPIPSEKRAIAILPFDDLSPQRDQEYLCDGLTETLITAFSKIERLHVPARASSFLFKNREKNYREIGKLLNVETILEGSVQKSQDRLRITTRLIDVSNESLIWSEQYDREFGDIFEIQDDISLAVVDKLKIGLAVEEKANLSERNTDSVEAYQLYLRAKHLRYREISRDYHRAKIYYEQAIDHDPNFAAAYAGLAEIYMRLGMRGHLPRDEADNNAKRCAQKALEIEPNSSEAHSSMALILEVFDWNWEEAERGFLHAVELDPNNSGAHYEHGLLLLRMKKLKKAEEKLLKALELDPLLYGPLVGLARICELTGQKDKAQKYNERIKEIRAWDEADEDPIESLKKNIAERGRLPALLGQLGAHLAKSGNSADAKKLVSELEAMFETSEISNIASALSWIMSSLGDKEKSLEWLGRSIERRDTAVIEINHLPWFDGIRDDPRFIRMMKEIGFEE
jgi:TolB-like protein